MSTLAAIVIVAALLLVGILAVGRRRAATSRARHELGAPDDDVHPYRSHAEASRRAPSR